MRDPKLWSAVVFSSLLLLSTLNSAAGPAEGGGGGSSSGIPDLEWQILTKRNFSSEIRRHPHLLLMVTVPWSGESRSLMKEVSQLVADKQEKLGYLKVRVVYRNSEKILADVLGASDGLTLFYYHRSTSYKYQGRLRAHNILSSVYHFLSLQIDDVPLKPLHTHDDLEIFFKSTDKAVLLLEFCGWSTQLLHRKNNENNETLLAMQKISENAGILEEVVNKEANITPEFDSKNKKGSENEELTCTVENGISGSPWFAGFAWPNQSVSWETESRSAAGMSCTLEEFQQFESFFLKFTTIAREYYLPPERQRFGLISERSLLPLVGVSNPKAWLLMLQFSGCNNCSIVLQDGDDLRTFLQIHNPLVTELDVDGHDLIPAFPANRPSIILFVDRSSDLSKARGESQSSLEALRKFAQNNQVSYQTIRGRDSGNYESSSSSFGTWSKSPSDLSAYQTEKDILASDILNIKDKVSIMIINNGESFSLEKTGSDNSAYGILTHLLQQNNPGFKTKKTKVSLLAKKVGFQLLSNDFEVQVMEPLASDKEIVQSDEMVTSVLMDQEEQISEFPEESTDHSDNINNGDLLSGIHMSAGNDGRQLELADMETVPLQNMETIPFEYSSSKFASKLVKDVKDEICVPSCTQADADNRNCRKEESELYTCHPENSFHLEGSPIIEEFVEQEHVDLADFSSSEKSTYGVANTLHAVLSIGSIGDDREEFDKSMTTRKLAEQNVQLQSFSGSVFFSDGGYQMLRALTGGSKIPSLVILDPVMQQHYVFSVETDIGYSSLVNFVGKFLNGSLTPYHKSASSIISSRESPRPPFVNQDFHEADSIPQVTVNTFCKLVVGFKHCEMGNVLSSSNIQNFTSAWKMDVLVFFSIPWCGFCQRMELIVREVYRAFKSFMNMKCESKNMDPSHCQDNLENTLMNKLPSVFLMDCTLNDCAPFLKPIGKKEAYPTLLLFPAEKKSTISYEGDMSVVNIIEFLASHGSNSQHLSMHKGFLWAQASKVHERRTFNDESSSLAVDERTPFAEGGKYDEFPLGAKIIEDTRHLVGTHDDFAQHVSMGSDDFAQHVSMGSVLIATDKLDNVSPFDGSKILIVMADRVEGFRGIIINKRTSWEVFKGDGEKLEIIKRAPIYYGGPVGGDHLALVSLARRPVEWYTKISAGLYFGDLVATSIAIERIKLGGGEGLVDDYWFFLCYSSWEWSQLSRELEEGAWHVSSSTFGHFEWPDKSEID